MRKSVFGLITFVFALILAVPSASSAQGRYPRVQYVSMSVPMSYFTVPQVRRVDLSVRMNELMLSIPQDVNLASASVLNSKRLSFGAPTAVPVTVTRFIMVPERRRTGLEFYLLRRDCRDVEQPTAVCIADHQDADIPSALMD